ncbi:ABC transporter permease [Streptomyces sp. LX-29]|uniref:ABC transporter permease n=1 Tax=Streptomyces sp. LX-29 TaxID=2900152 RepID=UPI00240E1286|nr:ABC transporter permease [Streptomyces sp. LX-29]WFB10288.1 ABC transporter permease [Streptomyces sp. LX-29]
MAPIGTSIGISSSTGTSTGTSSSPHVSFTDGSGNGVTGRAALLVLGALLLQLAFIASYVGAFHQPRPHRVALATVAPQQLRGQMVERLNGLPGRPFAARAASTEAKAIRQVERRIVDAALVVDPRSNTDRLFVAGAAGASLSDAVSQAVGTAEATQRRSVRVVDLVPAGKRDARGLTPFYLVLGWCVGGCLGAAMLAVSHGVRPANPRRALARLGAMALYAAVAGLTGAAIVGPWLHALPGALLPLWGLGALLVFAVGAATLALQGLAGVVGIGLAMLAVIVIGNPGSGGAYPYPLLPDLWRAVGPALPPGAGTWTTRSIAYFHGHATTRPLLVLYTWAAAGVVLTLVSAAVRGRRNPGPDLVLR